MKKLLDEIKQCKVCAKDLYPRPVLVAHSKSKIAIIGQAPGKKVHESGIAWCDPSGDNLRNWLGVTTEQFYDKKLFALIPMGFCYPGKGRSGDLPPRPECAPLWHKSLMSKMKSLKLIILIGVYSQEYYLMDKRKETLTETIKHFEDYLPKYFVLPHPSPRNNIWMAKNRWFGKKVLPELRSKIARII